MPCTYEVHSNANLLYCRLVGIVSIDDIRAVLTRAQQGPSFRPGMLVFNDMSRTALIDFGFAQMMEISARIRRIQATPKRFGACVFFTPGDLAYGMARMFRALAEPEIEPSIGICRDRDASFKFLRMDPADPYLRDNIAA